MEVECEDFGKLCLEENKNEQGGTEKILDGSGEAQEEEKGEENQEAEADAEDPPKIEVDEISSNLYSVNEISSGVDVTEDMEPEMESRNEDVFYNDIIMDRIFSNMDLTDLLTCRQVCSFWNRCSVYYVREAHADSLLLTDDRIAKFMEVMENSSPFPCSKFCLDFYCVSDVKLQKFCEKYGSYATHHEVMCCVRFQPDREDQYERIQQRKAPGINHKIAILLAYSPNVKVLKIRTRFEVSFKNEEIEKLPKVYPYLKSLKTECTFPMMKKKQTDMHSVIVSRAPRLRSLSINFSLFDTISGSVDYNSDAAVKAHALNVKLPEILQRLITQPKLSIRTMFTGKDYEVVEKLANIPMNLKKLIVQNQLRSSETTARQEIFLRWFVSWLSRCENHLQVLGLSTDGSEYMKVPPLKNLEHLNTFFNVMRLQPEIPVTPLLTNQFPNLNSLALFTFDPRHWQTPEGNTCVMNSVKNLEVGSNAAHTAPLPVIWRIMFPNMDGLTLRSPRLFQLSMVMSELTHLRNLRIYEMIDSEETNDMAALFGLDMPLPMPGPGPQNWVWNVFTNRPTRISDEDLLTFDPANETAPELANASLARFTSLETLTISGCCKDAARAIIYMSRTGRLRKLEHLCIIGEEDQVSPEALQILRDIHSQVCFHPTGEASEHDHYEFSVSW